MLNQPRSERDHKNVIEQGFTLVELLIVIVILGILAGVVIFAIGSLQQSAQAKSCQTEAATVKTAIQSFKSANPSATIGGASASQLTVMLDLTQPAAVTAPAVLSVNGNATTLQAPPNPNPPGVTAGGVLQATPKDYNTNGTGYWDYDGNRISAGYDYTTNDASKQAWKIDTSTNPPTVKTTVGCQ